MGLGHSLEDYLKAILVLKMKHDRVRSIDLAQYFNYSRASISHAVKDLKEKGYIQVLEQGQLTLTSSGHRIANKLYERYLFFYTMLIHAGVDASTADKEACGLEHVVSEESFKLLKNKYMKDRD